MSEVDALFRLLAHAPPRAAAIVRRAALEGTPPEALARLYDLGPAEAQVLLLRALVDVKSGGTLQLDDAAEQQALAELFATPRRGEYGVFFDALVTHRAALVERLEKAAADFAASPDRARDEWLRRLAIAVVLALTAYFWHREQNKPRPPPEKRPTVAPSRN
ncbi:MAG: hypothetical protein ACOZQL_25745 [Myxococcota bacterium]